MKVSKNVDAKAIDNQNEHILYVEGDEHSIDVTVLNVLLGNTLWIQPLGVASSIQSVAKSLYPTHPKSYFLIDRDYHLSDEQIETFWRNFPDPNTSNLLVWRRRELENYFLESSFLIESRFCKDVFKKNNGQQIQEKIVSLTNERLYLDTANYVIVSLREDFKRKWIESFSNPSDFPDEKSALNQLTMMPEFKVFSERVSRQIAEQEITKRFQKFLDRMTGGNGSLQWGTGEWLSMISGKSIFRSLVGQCFHVTNQENKILQGKAAINLVVRDLLQMGRNLPKDFLELKGLIDKRIMTNS